jgi:predicted Zn-dependent protease
MSENPRIEDLRRRVQKDPTSIAFAQLAEEHRRSHEFEQAIQVCRAGLAVHPGYLSARVTLGRALLELSQLDEARSELELVRRSAPDNLAALRGLAEIHHKHGDFAEALSYYKAALALAPNDPDLAQTIGDLAVRTDPQPRSEPIDGLSLEQMQQALTSSLPTSRQEAVSPEGPAAMTRSVHVDRERSAQTVAALEQWLAAIDVSRANRRA